MRYTDQGLFGGVVVNSTDLEQDCSGLDARDPIFSLALTLTHSSFQRLGTDWFVGEDSNVYFSLTMEVVSRRNTTSFELAGGYPVSLASQSRSSSRASAFDA